MRTPHEVMVFVRRGDDVLVLHRAPDFDPYWHLVSGGVEAGESAREAALRELQEEAGLELEELVNLERRYTYPLEGESEFVRSRYDPSVEEVVVEAFVAEAPEGWEPTLNEEHDDYRWCTVDEAAELLFWPEPRELVRALPS